MKPVSTVLFPLIGKNYEVTLGNLLRSTGYNVIEAGDEACFDDLYDTICASLDGTSTVIVDVENTSCIGAIIRAAQTLVKNPNIIIITSLLTWCGEVSCKSVTDPDTDFCSRIPLHCARKSYDLESALWNATLNSRLGDGYTYFVGIGLIYGGSGWDFEDSLRRLWSSSHDSSAGRGIDQEHSHPNISSHHGMKNNSLQVHCDDFFNTVLHLMDAGCYPSPSYFPLVEGVLASEERGQGPGDLFMQHHHLDSCGIMTAGDRVLWDPKSAFLTSKLKFNISSATLPKLTCRNFATIWKEFTSTQGLVPHNLMFVGGPQCGQTEIAKAVSMMLDLQYVDIADTLKWVLESTLSRVAAERASGTSGSHVESGRLLVDLVSAKILEGSKKGSAVVTEAVLRSFIFSESYIQTLPSTLQRKCVALRLQSCSKCNMKGFALDIWSAGHTAPTQTALLSNAQDFLEVLPPSLTRLHAPLDDGCAGSMHPVLTLIDIQSDKKGTLQRIAAKFVDGKGTKEQLIGLKVLEARAEMYASRLQDVPPGVEFMDLGAQTPLVTHRSHEVVLDFIQLTNCRAFRMCMDEQSSAGGAAQLVADELTSSAAQVSQLEGTPSAVNRCSDEAAVPARAAIDHDSVARLASNTTDGDGDGDRGGLISKINEGLVGLKANESESLMANCNELLQYLAANVNPFVAKSLIYIERTRPSDPIQCLIEALEEQGRSNRARAEAIALAEFHRILDNAGKRT